MITYALSSAWLYSPGYIQKIREWFIDYFESKDSSFKYLGICQLCSGFWFGLFVSFNWIYADSHDILVNITASIVYALIAAVFSWTLGAFTNMCLWKRALIEKLYEKK